MELAQFALNLFLSLACVAIFVVANVGGSNIPKSSYCCEKLSTPRLGMLGKPQHPSRSKNEKRSRSKDLDLNNSENKFLLTFVFINCFICGDRNTEILLG